MEHIESYTCVRFLEGSNNKGHFINVTTNENVTCHARIGYQKRVGQELNLQMKCMNKGSIAHEFLHALGFVHQHNTENRDSYVKVQRENLDPQKSNNFYDYPENVVSQLGFQYDYDSIMHYGRYQGSTNGEPVLKALKHGAEHMGQRNGLSLTDINKINKMYSCSERIEKTAKFGSKIILFSSIKNTIEQ